MRKARPRRTFRSSGSGVGDTGLEPVTPSLSSCGHNDVSEDTKAFTSSPSAACPPACTSNANSGNEGPLDHLAEVILSLSPEDRSKLAELLSPKSKSN